MGSRGRSYRFFLIMLLLAFAGSAFANTCDNFAAYSCAQGTPDIARLGGGSAIAQSVGFVLSGTASRAR